ncbi:MAG: hypothetical protein JW801_04830 [Bacteroidales bacterium]|nr:hypothetical protein [Bacteroidales bacterium]
MKKIFTILPLMIFGLAISVNAQEFGNLAQPQDEFKTIFGGRNLGGYGAAGIGYTLVDDRQGISFDGRFGAMLNHSFAMGVGGAGFINSDEEITALNQRIFLSGGYGGVFAELILLPKFPVHLSFPVLAGLGGITAASVTATSGDGTIQNNIQRTLVFMIVEPAVELEFSFTRTFRLAGYFSYRFTTDVFMEDGIAASDALTNYSAGLRIKFGKF